MSRIRNKIICACALLLWIAAIAPGAGAFALYPQLVYIDPIQTEGERITTYYDIAAYEGDAFIAVGQSAGARIILFDAQTRDILYEETVGTPGDVYYSVTVLDDGYIVAGSATARYSAEGAAARGGGDGVLIKFNRQHEVEWEAVFGGAKLDMFFHVAETDGGFVATGYTKSSDGDVEEDSADDNSTDSMAVVVFFDRDGQYVWHRVGENRGADISDTDTDTTEYRYDGSFSNVCDAGDGILVVGYAEVTKVVEWDRSLYPHDLRGFYKDYLDIHIDPSYRQAVVQKYSYTGELLWENVYGQAAYKNETTCDAVLALEDGILLVLHSNEAALFGEEWTYYGEKDAVFVKLDARGNLMWAKPFGGSGDDKIEQLAKNNDGGFVAVGYSNSLDYDFETSYAKEQRAMIVMLDDACDVVWYDEVNGSKADRFYAAAYNDERFVAVGETESSDGYFTKLELSGKTAFLACYVDPQNPPPFLDNPNTQSAAKTQTEQQGISGEGWIVIVCVALAIVLVGWMVSVNKKEKRPSKEKDATPGVLE